MSSWNWKSTNTFYAERDGLLSRLRELLRSEAVSIDTCFFDHLGGLDDRVVESFSDLINLVLEISLFFFKLSVVLSQILILFL